MNWFEVIKADEGRHGKHLTKLYMFLRRFFGNPPDKTNITFEFHGRLKTSPNFNVSRSSNFDKYYITLEEVFEQGDVTRFARSIIDLQRCFDMEYIIGDYGGNEMWNEFDDTEIIPGFFFSSNNALFEVKFDNERHIKMRDWLYKKNNPDHYRGQYLRDKKYKTREDLQEELESKTAYWQRYESQRALDQKKYGKYDACLQSKYKDLDGFLKISNNYWYGQRRRDRRRDRR